MVAVLGVLVHSSGDRRWRNEHIRARHLQRLCTLLHHSPLATHALAPAAHPLGMPASQITWCQPSRSRREPQAQLMRTGRPIS